MRATIFTASSWDTTALEWLFAGSIRIAALLMLAVLLVVVLRRASARSRYQVWTAAVLGVLALPFLVLIMPAWRIDGLPRPDLTLAGAGWIRLVVGAWLVGMLFFLGRLAIAIGWTRLTIRDAELIRSDTWNDVLAEMVLAAGLTRPVKLMMSDAITSPITAGVLRPVVLLPAAANSWSAPRKRVVLLHELVHIARHDWLFQVLAQVACALHWFNPLVWTAARWLAIERERACDIDVVATGTRPSEYASHLLEVARHGGRSQATMIASLAMARHSQLEGRLLAILNGDDKARSASRLHIPILIVMLAAALALAAARPLESAAHPAAPVLTASSELRQAANDLVALDDRIFAFEEQIHTIGERKEPLYEELESLRMTIASTSRTQAEALKTLIASPAEAQPALTAQTDAIGQRLSDLLAKETELENQLDLHIDEWNGIIDILNPLYDELEGLADTLDAATRDLLADVIGQHTSDRPAAEAAATAILGAAAPAIHDGQLWLDVTPESVEAALRTTSAMDEPAVRRLTSLLAGVRIPIDRHPAGQSTTKTD